MKATSASRYLHSASKFIPHGRTVLILLNCLQVTEGGNNINQDSISNIVSMGSQAAVKPASVRTSCGLMSVTLGGTLLTADEDKLDTDQSGSTGNMSATRWDLLQQIFLHAIDMPPDDRTAYVCEACDNDSELINQVEALIASDSSDEEMLSRMIQVAAKNAVAKQDITGQQIGTFRIIDSIGDGGMGVVYLAHRDDDEFIQKVAIKVLHDRVASKETQQRFLAERQILANLNHPNIARLIDGGHTSQGQPYIVMEYIDGEPLDDYCDHHQLGIVQRLELFKQVCYAVADAHRNLIVHRDIKSNNILVAEDGVPKLLDFGIAKVLTDHLGTVDLAETQLGSRLLTPDYASPEQVLGKSVTTATDIYSLGILLYQLISGCRPFSLASSSPAEMERTICHEIPLAPSQAVASLSQTEGKTQQSVASKRSLSPSRLKARLKGELDHIVLMALKKEPHRRYQSASQFAADIDRHLEGLPIVAVNDSRRYRAQKFVARNRIAVATATLFVTALSAFSLSTYFQAKEISAQALDITKQKESVEDSLNFITGVFQAANPEVLQKQSPSALDILEFAEQKIEQDMADRPEILGRLRQTIGGAYLAQAEIEKARKNYHASLEATINAHGENHPYTAGVLQDLGRFYLKTDIQQAEQYFQQAMDILDNKDSIQYFKNNPSAHQAAIQNLFRNVAELELAQGKWNEAQVHLNYAIEISLKLLDNPKYTDETAANLSMLGALHLRLSNFEQSEKYVKDALQIVRRHRSDKHTYVAELLDDLALIKHAQGDLDEAEQLYRESLAIREAVFGEGDIKLNPSKANLGRFLGDMGELEPARALLTEVVESSRESFGTTNHELGFDMVTLGKINADLGAFPQAEALFLEALDIYTQTVGDRHVFFAEAQRQFGNLRVHQGRLDEAIERFDTALKILGESQTSESWQTAATLSDKAEAQIGLGQYENALIALGQAMPMLEKTLGKDHRLWLMANDRLRRAAHLKGQAMDSKDS